MTAQYVDSGPSRRAWMEWAPGLATGAAAALSEYLAETAPPT
ncbi:hypothetical protein [Streptomyces sp. NPDC055400]